MKTTLVKLIAHFAVFLELADDTAISPDSAVQLQEELAFRLQSLDAIERAEFLRLLAVIADEETSPERKAILTQLPQDVGIA